MKIVMIAFHDHGVFPTFSDIALSLASRGAEVHYITRSPFGPKLEGVRGVHAIHLAPSRSRVPWFRSGSGRILSILRRLRPALVIAQHEYIIPSLVYKRLFAPDVKIGVCFFDHDRDRRYMKAARIMAGMIDIHIEGCHVLSQMRREDWPRMKAEPFVLRYAPLRRGGASFQPHAGPVRIACTSSRYILMLNRERLSRFLGRLCDHGIAIDWFFPQTGDSLEDARSVLSHPLFAIRPRVEKDRLIDTLAGYDVGLHWAPIVEQDFDVNYFRSTASNKVGEYVAAGLAVAYAGNPGLSFLPPEVSIVYDPTDPEAGADQLAAALSDRAAVERMRRASLDYHLEHLNFDAQAEPILRHVERLSSPRRD